MGTFAFSAHFFCESKTSPKSTSIKTKSIMKDKDLRNHHRRELKKKEREEKDSSFAIVTYVTR